MIDDSNDPRPSARSDAARGRRPRLPWRWLRRLRWPAATPRDTGCRADAPQTTIACAIRSRFTEGMRTVEIFIGSQRGDLTPAQRADVRLRAVPGSAKRPAASSIDVPTGTANEQAAAEAVQRDPLDPRRRRRAADGIVVRRYRPCPTDQVRHVELNYPRMTAERRAVRAVAARSRPERRSRVQRERARTGISAARTQRNLAAMVDNPADLVQPRGETPPYTARRTMVLDKYRKGEATATIYPDAEQGQDQRRRQMIRYQDKRRTHRVAPAIAEADESSRRRRAFRCRRSAKPSRPPPPCRPPREDRRLAKVASAHPDGRHRRRARGLQDFADAQRHHHRIREPRRRHPRRARRARRGLRRRHPGHRDRPPQRRRALSRADPARHQRLSHRADRHASTSCARSAACSRAPDAKPVGRVLAVVGAKGGVGASTVAHNIAWAIARDLHLDSVVADLDLAFGTAGLDFNQDPPQGIADAVFSPDRVDTAFIDRLLSKCTDHLSLLAAPATLDRVYDFGAEAFDPIFDVAARDGALRRARRAAPVDRLDQARADRRRRHPGRRGARSRQPAQRQEPASTCCAARARTIGARSTASTRSACPSGPRSSRPTSPRRSRTSRSRSSRSSRRCSAPPPTTAR